MIHSARDSSEATRISTWLHAFDYLRAEDHACPCPDRLLRALTANHREDPSQT